MMDQQQRARTIIERALLDLTIMGLTDEGAVELLLIQSACRMPDAASIRAALGDMLDDTLD
jgi:hypothetical protein